MFSFRLGSIPVRVHVSFLLVVALLGANSGGRGLVAWVAVVFVSVLLHELAHALAAVSFGLAPQIDLVGFGGFTSWSGGRDALGTWRRIVISVAGPGVGIVLGLALLVWQRMHPDASREMQSLLDMAEYVNLGWGLMNLLPIVPLDGGDVLRAVLQAATGGRGDRLAHIVSIVVAVLCGLAVVAFWGMRDLYPLMLLAMFVAQNVRGLNAGQSVQREAPLRDTLRAGYDALARGDTAAATRAGHAVLAGSSFPAIRADAVRLLAFSHLSAGAWGPFMALMDSPASFAIPDEELRKFEQAARELDRPEEAARIAQIRASRAMPQA